MASSTLETNTEKSSATPQVNKTATGLKRPTTALTQRPTAAQTVSVGSSSSKPSAPSITGVVKAKALASGLRKPTEAKNSFVEPAKEKEEIEVEQVKKTPVKLRHSIAPAGPKSADKDETDAIYNNVDPIFSSLEIRKKAGNISQAVKDPNSKAGKFFFTLKIKGPQMVISEKALYANAKEEGRVDA